tara:strand:+ start:2240 stop:3364 length:1125 start_codon:yes stop_codon:yes gene_type:complete
MKNLNVIIILIDGGRLDYVLKSDFYKNLKSDFSFISQPITYGPHTIASMHATFSGCYGTRTGTDSYWSTYNFKKTQFKTITDYLHENNYYTLCDIVNKLVIPEKNFDEFLIHDEQKDDLATRHCNFLEKLKSKNEQEQNFFAFFQFSNIHTGIMNEVLKVYDNFSEDYFNNTELNKQRYQSLFDKSEIYLKQILEKIVSLGLEKDSLILIMSDHGISIGEKVGERAYGAFCYDYTLRTFAYMKFPNMQKCEINHQVRTIDFMPTVLDILKIELDNNYEKLDGESLLPIFHGKNLTEKLAFSETGNPLYGKRPPEKPNTFSVRTSKWKLIFNEHNDTKELYDLELDPLEENNIAGTGSEIEQYLIESMNKTKQKS